MRRGNEVEVSSKPSGAIHFKKVSFCARMTWCKGTAGCHGKEDNFNGKGDDNRIKKSVGDESEES